MKLYLFTKNYYKKDWPMNFYYKNALEMIFIIKMHWKLFLL